MKIFITGLLYNKVRGEDFTIKEDGTHIQVTGNKITFNWPESDHDQIGNTLMIDFSAANVNSIEDYLGQWKNCTRTLTDEVSLKWLECTNVPYVDGQEENVWKDMATLVPRSNVYSLKEEGLIFDRPSAHQKRILRFLIAIEPIYDSCKVLFIYAEQEIIDENNVKFTVHSVKSVEKDVAGEIELFLVQLDGCAYDDKNITDYNKYLNSVIGIDESEKVQFEDSKYIVEQNQ